MSQTVILLIIDESYSMLHRKRSVIEGYNNCIEEQKLIEDDLCRVYTLKFNDKVTILNKGCYIDSALPLNSSNYIPSGYTALFDAVGKGITLVEGEKKEKEKVFCVIMTDGEENCSKLFDLKMVKDLIERNDAKGDWKFLYIGENPEMWTSKVGLSVTDGVQFDHADCRANFATASLGLSSYRTI